LQLLRSIESFSDEELCQAIINGDGMIATKVLYIRFDKTIVSFIHYRLSKYGRIDLFEDLKSDIYLEIMTSIMNKKYDATKGSLNQYMYGIFKHSFMKKYNNYSNPKEKNITEEDDLMRTLILSVYDLLQMEIDVNVFDLLEEAILLLKPKYFQVIKLRFYDEEPYSTISKKLGVLEGTLRSRVYYALNFLEQKINELKHKKQKTMEIL